MHISDRFNGSRFLEGNKIVITRFFFFYYTASTTVSQQRPNDITGRYGLKKRTFVNQFTSHCNSERYSVIICIYEKAKKTSCFQATEPNSTTNRVLRQ